MEAGLDDAEGIAGGPEAGFRAELRRTMVPAPRINTRARRPAVIGWARPRSPDSHGVATFCSAATNITKQHHADAGAGEPSQKQHPRQRFRCAHHEAQNNGANVIRDPMALPLLSASGSSVEAVRKHEWVPRGTIASGACRCTARDFNMMAVLRGISCRNRSLRQWP